MAMARFKDLCLDASDPARLGAFWAAVLDRTWAAQDNGDGLLTGPTPQHTVWVNRVPEAKTVKHRVHLDIYARELAVLETLGATIVEPPHATRTWTVMADPEGGEFCAFLRAEVPAERLHGLVVDSADPQAQARWWAGVYGVGVTQNDGWSTLEGVPGMPILTMDFVPVPEPKTVKNRIHWDVTVPAVAPLVAAGARVLGEPGGDIGWHVLADPEGNEFCAFTE
jgi:Glyoxalase-like domain